VRMTQEGAELLARAREVLEQLDMLPRLIGPQSRHVAGRVVIGLPTSTAAVMATPLLRAAIERYPNVRVHLIESLSGYLREWIESGRLDLAVLFDAHATPGIRLDPILIEDLWLVGRPGSLPTGLDEIALRELAHYPLVIPGPSHSNRRLLEGAALSHGVRLNILAEVDSLTIQKQMVSDGQVFTALVQGSMVHELAAGSLQAVRIIEPAISRSVSLAASMTRSDTHACHAIAKLTLETATTLLRAGSWRGRASGDAG
jgi:LysR family nitrogen assimilation transcriptional regulator